MKKSLLIISILLLSLFGLCACNKEKNNEPDNKDNNPKLEATFDIYHNGKFGGIDVGVSIDDFNKLGFAYGDSINVKLDNGKGKIGIPYYNGYYSRRGDPLLCAYPGYEMLHLANNNGDDLFVQLDADKATKVTITLKESGKYKVQQDVMDTVYSNDRNEFTSDAEFANYRKLVGGTIFNGNVYRGVSPVNNEYNRALYLNELIKNDEIGFILDLSDTEADLEKYQGIESYKYNESYFKDLYDDGKVALLGLGSNFGSTSFKESLGRGLKEMIKHEAPYYIHCTEGKDRTGFVCLLLEALCEATYQEIKTDYMITYDNYYKINENNLKDKYDAIVGLKLYDMVKYLTDESDIENFDYILFSDYAVTYLKDCGLNNDDIKALKKALTETNKCIVTFDSDGGTPVETRLLKPGSEVGEIPTVTKEGYTFVGWYIGNNRIDAYRYVVYEDVNFKARWQKND